MFAEKTHLKCEKRRRGMLETRWGVNVKPGPSHFIYPEYTKCAAAFHGRRSATSKIRYKEQLIEDNWEIVKYVKDGTEVNKSRIKFLNLATKWKLQTAHFSTTFHKVNNSNYLKIIAMGEKALPYILKDLEKYPDHWFVALDSIITENAPIISEEDFGDMREMSKAWVEWGKKNNIIA